MAEKKRKYCIGEKACIQVATEIGCSVSSVYLALRGITESELADKIRQYVDANYAVRQGKRKAVFIGTPSGNNIGIAR